MIVEATEGTIVKVVYHYCIRHRVGGDSKGYSSYFDGVLELQYPVQGVNDYREIIEILKQKHRLRSIHGFNVVSLTRL